MRPAYQSKELLAEFCGDHRAEGFPKLAQLLAQALDSKEQPHPVFDTPKIAMETDRFFSYWAYDKGTYEIDDDIWACFISAPQNNVQVIADIERVLLESGLFIREEIDFANYA